MKRASLAIILLLMASTFFVGLGLVPTAKAATLYVGGFGPGNYSTLQSAVNAANPGDTIFVYNGTYTENVVVDKPLSLVREDKGTAIINGGGTGVVVNVTSDWVNITGFTVTNSWTNWGGGLVLYSVHDCRIANINASSNYLNGIFLWYSDNNTIVNNTASGSVLGGIALWTSSGNIVADNVVEENDEGILAFNSDDNTFSSNTASNNTFGMQIGSSSMSSSGNTIVDNHLHSNTASGIFLSGSNNVISSNNVSSNGDDGIRLESARNNVVANNTANADTPTSAGWQYGILVRWSDNNTIVNNTASNNTDGIHLLWSRGNTITNNLMVENGIYIFSNVLEDWNTHAIDTSNTVNGRPVYYWNDASGGKVPLDAGQVILANCTGVTVENQDINGIYAGILLGFSSGNIIANNTVSENGIGIEFIYSLNNIIRNNSASYNLQGIRIWWSNNNTITENNAHSNFEYGIGVVYDSNNNTVLNNTLFSNGWLGMGFLYSDNNTIAYNAVSSNGNLGIRLESASNNRVHHNDIVNNVGQAADDTDLNQWDTGYPAGGNYWGDYNGIDNCSGPNQDICPDPDGIGDTPYVIDADSQDRYPLMSGPPVPPYPPSAPRNLQATPRSQRITLSWNPPAFEGRSPITNYTVYRGVVQGGEVFLVELGNVLNHTDLSLINAQTYYYQVSARNGVGEGPRSDEVNATPSAQPWAPLNLTVVPGNGQVTLDWSPPAYDGDSPITNYTVYRGTSPGGESLLTQLGDVPSYLDTDVTNGVAYYYQLSAVNVAGEGAKSEEVNATPLGPPSAPQNLQALGGDQNVSLTWDRPATDGGFPITNYRIYRGVAPGGEVFLQQIGNVTNYTDFSVTNGQTYYYEVRARNAFGEGPESNEARATPGVAPGVPKNLTAMPWIGEIALTWLPPEDDGGHPVTNYSIYRGPSPGGGVFLTEIGNMTTHVDTGLTAGQTYYYTVTANNAVGEGPESNEANATPIAIPREPTILHCNLGGSSLENVTLIWSLSPDDGAGLQSVIGYEIFRNETYDRRGAGYGLIAFLSNGTSTFTDYSAGEGNPSRYFYTVCAVDAYNNRACAVSQASKFARFLAKGPNLVSIPLIQSNESIETVLQTVKYDKAWFYDSSSQEWKWHMKSKGYRRGLWNVNHTMGLWVNVTANSNLTVAGVVPAQMTIHLYKGWNLVSFPSFNSTYTVSDLKAEIGATRVEGYDSLPPYHLRVVGDAEVLLAGEAYWVKMEAETDWMVEVS